MSDAETASYLTEEYINRLKELTEALGAGDNQVADQLIGELTTLRESSLFQELGKLTREIHESINAFQADARIVELAQEDIPDAKERLNYIITKTDEAAHRTMEGTEAVLEMVDVFNHKADDIQQQWQQFRTSAMSKQDFLAMSDDIDRFLSSVSEDSDKVKAKMTDIMMAQDYQDLTGQMIKQVITMVQEVEEKLVRLVAISGASLGESKKTADDGAKAHGPQLPNADKQEVATSQNEVDDLLASMGF